MLELGRRGQVEHESLGRFVAKGHWAGVAVLARHPADAAAQAIADGFRDGGGGSAHLFAAPDPAEAAAWLRERLSPGDALLLKASRGVRIERVLEELKKDN